MVRAKKGGEIPPAPPEHGQRPVVSSATPAGADVRPLAKPTPAGSGQSAPALPAGAMGSLTAPTNRPQEPITAGLDRAMAERQVAGQGLPSTGLDADAALRALYRIYPHPQILELLT